MDIWDEDGIQFTGDMLTGSMKRHSFRGHEFFIERERIPIKPNSVEFAEGNSGITRAHELEFLSGGVTLVNGSEVSHGKVRERTRGRAVIVPLRTHHGLIQVEVTKRFWRVGGNGSHVWVEQSDRPDMFRLDNTDLYESPRAIFHR